MEPRRYYIGVVFALLMLACSPPPSSYDERPEDPTDENAAVPMVDDPPPRKPSPALIFQRIPGTKVKMSAPPGFLVADDFPGFHHPQTLSAIIITELPGPYAELVVGMEDADAQASQAVQILDSTEQRQGKYEGKLLRLRQTVANVTVEKWLWVFGDATETVTVMAMCNQSACDADLERLRDSVLTASWDPTLEVPVTEGLGFSLADYAGLQVVGSVGRTLLLNMTGGVSELGSDCPMDFAAGPAMGSGPIEDQKAFARARVAALPYEAIKIEEVKRVERDGLEGLRVLASAKLANGAPVFVYTVLLFELDNYWLLTGGALKEQRTEATRRFEKIVAGFRRN